MDSGWDWLPWNWMDGIGKQVMYGLYAIKFYLDNQPVSFQRHGVSDSRSLLAGLSFPLRRIPLGKICRPLAGVTTGGLSSEGFYIGFLLILILVVGIYVSHRAYQTEPKSHPCRCQFRGGVRAVRCLYRLCS